MTEECKMQNVKCKMRRRARAVVPFCILNFAFCISLFAQDTTSSRYTPTNPIPLGDGSWSPTPRARATDLAS